MSASVEVSPFPGYRGPDRRGQLVHAPDGTRRRAHLVVLGAIGSGLLISLAVGRLDLPAGSSLLWTSVAGALGGAAGVLGLLRWRVLADSAAAAFGLAFILVGFALLVPEPLPTAGPDGAVAPDMIRLCLLAVAPVVAIRAARTAQVDPAFPVRGWLVVLALVPLAAGVVHHVANLQPTGPATLAGGQLLVGMSLAAGGWWAHLRLPARSDTSRWVSSALLALAAGQAFQAAALLDGPRWLSGAQHLRLVALLLAVIAAVRDLDHAYEAQRDRLFGSVLDQRVVAVRTAAAEVVRAAQRHALQSSVTAIDGAATVLGRYAGELDVGTREDLRRAVTAQLEQVRLALDDPDRSGRATVGLDHLLSPLVRELQLRGTPLTLDVPTDLAALAHPGDLVAAVHLLVTDAADAGHAVVVRAAVDGRLARVRVLVDDHDPAQPWTGPDGVDATVVAQLLAGSGGQAVHVAAAGRCDLFLPLAPRA